VVAYANISFSPTPSTFWKSSEAIGTARKKGVVARREELSYEMS